LCTLRGNRPSLQEICHEYAAQTMFCQNQAYPTENKPEKSQIFLAFLFPKKPMVLKKNRFSKSGIKKAKLATLLHKN